MQYEYRDVDYKGMTMRFIKPENFNSDDIIDAPIEKENTNVFVIIMIGRSNTAASLPASVRDFTQQYHRKPDQFYLWQTGVFNKQ